MKARKKIISAVLLTVLLTFVVLCSSGCECKHEYESVVTPPTCTDEGFTTYTCTKCGESYVDDKVAALGHDYSSVFTPPSCTVEGFMTYTCTRCGDTYTENTAAALGHNYGVRVTTEPTCKKDGVKTYTCTRCDDSYTESFKLDVKTSEAIYNESLKSVGEIKIYNKSKIATGLGSCFAIDRKGTFVTNYHVVEEAYYAVITVGDFSFEVEKVLAYDEEKDIAVIQASFGKYDSSKVTPVKICHETPVGGWTVYAAGNPKGFSLTFTSGVISSPSRDIDGVKCIQHDASISNGSSGGPLYNPYGEVIGVNAWSYSGGNNLNFAISISELDTLDYSSPLTLPELYEQNQTTDVVVREVEPNNSISSAQTIEGGQALVLAEISNKSDVDYYAVTVKSGQAIAAIIIDADSTLDLDVDIVNSRAGILATSMVTVVPGYSDVPVKTSFYINTSKSDVTVYIRVKSSGQTSSDSLNYGLMVYCDDYS